MSSSHMDDKHNPTLILRHAPWRRLGLAVGAVALACAAYAIMRFRSRLGEIQAAGFLSPAIVELCAVIGLAVLLSCGRRVAVRIDRDGIVDRRKRGGMMIAWNEIRYISVHRRALEIHPVDGARFAHLKLAGPMIEVPLDRLSPGDGAIREYLRDHYTFWFRE